MPQWVYSWYGWGRPAWAAFVPEGPAGPVTGAAGPLPHAARITAMTAPAIGGQPRRSRSFGISLLARVMSASTPHFDAPTRTAVPARQRTGGCAGWLRPRQRTEAGIAGLKGQLAARKSSLGKLIATEKATLASLTVPQQQAVANNSIGAG